MERAIIYILNHRAVFADMFLLTIAGIIIIIIIISFMQGIYTYIPETNHVPREYSVSAILSLLFMVPISLVPALALFSFFFFLLLLLLLIGYSGKLD